MKQVGFRVGSQWDPTQMGLEYAHRSFCSLCSAVCIQCKLQESGKCKTLNPKRPKIWVRHGHLGEQF